MKRKLTKDELEKITLNLWAHVNIRYPNLQDEIISLGERKVKVNMGGVSAAVNCRCMSQGKRIQSYIITSVSHDAFGVEIVWKYAKNVFSALNGTLRVKKGLANMNRWTSFIGGIAPATYQGKIGREADHLSILEAAMAAPLEVNYDDDEEDDDNG